MRAIVRLITKTFSIRLSLMVVLALATLLAAALLTMFRFSRKALKEEVLQKADQTLEMTVQHIGNALHDVELATINMRWTVEAHLDSPDKMYAYTQKVLELNPNITGCAIAFEPYYYPGKGRYFMAYTYRNGASADSVTTQSRPVIQPELFGNKPYPEQEWYAATKKSDRPYWSEPMLDEYGSGEPIATYCLPIHDTHGHMVGVMGVDLSLKKLSHTILAAKPSPNSYSVLLSGNGMYIVHPDSSKLFYRSVFSPDQTDDDPTVKSAAQAMLAGQSDYQRVKLKGINSLKGTQLKTTDCYVFYKPFNSLGWSVGIVYPEEDIFGKYNDLIPKVLGITGVSILLLLVFGLWIAYHQLAPLQLLNRSVQRIADGHFDEPIPDSHLQDEIGQLQDNFQRMQQSLAAHVKEMERLSDALQEQGKVLGETYERVQATDRAKTSFLHYMTDQMIAPINAINSDVRTLKKNCRQMEQNKTNRLVDDIRTQGDTVAELLNDMLRKI